MENTIDAPRRSAGQTPGRKPRGRPSVQEATDIKAAILDSAENRFARQGYSATSVREIADDVEVNPAMIHYYFGSKRALLQQVLERALAPLAGAIAQLRKADQAPAGEIARLLIDTLKNQPNLPPLVIREIMLPGGVMQDHFIEFLAPRLGGAVPALLGREQAGGRMDSGLDPRQCALTLLSLCIFPFVVRDTAERALAISLHDAGLDALEDHIQQILERGFTP